MDSWTWVHYEHYLESVMSQLRPVNGDGPLLPIELCDLTCKAWLPRSRHRLYERIELKTWNVLSRQNNANAYLPARLQRLIATLRAHRILYGYVRRLTIDPSYPAMESFPDYGERDGMSALSISLFFPYPLKNLKELHLGWMSLALTHSQFFRALALHTSVTTLSIVRVSFAMGTQIARLIHCFPALSNLRVEEIDITFDDHNTLAPVSKSQRRTRLSTFRFSGDAKHFESLMTLAIPFSIETVRYMHIECLGFAGISIAVARSGSSLVDLHLILESQGTTPSSLDHIDFHTNTSLQTISLKADDGISITKLPLLCAILSTISSTNLRRLSLELNFTETITEGSSVDINVTTVQQPQTFVSLDKLLQTKVFCSLELVSVRTRAVEPYPPQGDIFLPHTSKRGILEWTYWQRPRLDW